MGVAVKDFLKPEILGLSLIGMARFISSNETERGRNREREKERDTQRGRQRERESVCVTECAVL